MKNRELIAEFGDCLPGSRVAIVNPDIDANDYERYGIFRVTYLNNSDPRDTIIEASREYKNMLVEDLTGFLGREDPDGDAQVYIEGWEGQHFAYFDIKEVRQGPYLHSIILGAWRCGG